MSNSLYTIFLVMIPILIYIFSIWLIMPHKTIRLKPAFNYLFFGVISITILNFFWFLFPEFFSHSKAQIFKNGMIDFYFYKSFIQVAFPEELAKMLAFFWITKTLFVSDKNTDNPLEIFFYYGMIGLSFGMIENLQYANRYGTDIIFVRSFTALLLHLMVGFLAGFWVAKTKLKQSIQNKSILAIYTQKFPKIRTYSLYLTGLIIASFIHGVYDFNLFVQNKGTWSLMFTQLGIIVFIVYVAALNLIVKTENE
jgi:RsiW-degrading membrane proteinase PrsW (M82 family)